jgi:exopolysaccharide biosynthesis polyprenyl glycosylphosphotransferase
MKKINQLFSFLLLPVDAIMVFGAFIIAYTARAGAIAFPVIYIWPFDQYLTFALQMLPIWLIAFAFAGLYKSQRKYIFEFGQIITAASLGAMAVVLWVFVFRSDFFSRLIVFYIWALSIIFVSIGRAVLGLIRSNLYLFGHKGTGLILAGNELETIETMIEQIKKDKSLGYRLIGVVTDKELKDPEFKVLGEFKDFDEIIKHHMPEEVILADPNFKNEGLFHLMRCCQELDIQFKAVPAHAAVSASTLQYDAFAGIPIIEFRGTPLDSWGIVIKRIFDLIFSFLALIILSPVMLIIALIIKFSSKGPVIYKNIRVGHRGEFNTYKFRTMYTDYCTGEAYGGSRAEEYENKLIETNNIKKGSAVYKIADDPRVTKIGNFLRKTSLDELPQFFNVLVGNMSIVGPRPHQPREVINYTREQRKLLMIKPGITGLAQISGRSDLSFNEEARLDISYLENWSIWLDLVISLKTFTAAFKGKGSY